MSEEKHGRLGRGLSALIGDAEADFAAPANDRGRSVREVAIDRLKPNPFQPRQSFSEEELDELARSIREKGILQPIVARPVAGDPHSFQIVAGERRWRAAQRAQIHNVPVVVKELTDSEALEVAIVENVQRSDLNPVEEAGGYQALIEQFHHTQDELAKIIGKSRSYIANALRLLMLPQSVLDMISSGKLSPGHAKSLVSAQDPEAVARAIVEKGLSVREAETMARGERGSVFKPRAALEKNPDLRDLEKGLTEKLGIVCEIVDHGDRGGELRIKYKTMDQLDHVLNIIERYYAEK